MKELNLVDVIKTIESYKEFKKDWNGYGAEPISEKVINKALELVKQLTPVPSVFPTACNSIQFEWEVEGLYVELEVFEDDIKMFSMAKHNGKDVSIGDY